MKVKVASTRQVRRVKHGQNVRLMHMIVLAFWHDKYLAVCHQLLFHSPVHFCTAACSMSLDFHLGHSSHSLVKAFVSTTRDFRKAWLQ